MKDMIMVLGLLVILVLVVDRMISKMPEMLFPEETAENTKRVMVDDVLFLQKIRKYIKPSDYTVFTGHSGEVVREMNRRQADMVVVDSGLADEVQADFLNHMTAYYYATALEINGYPAAVLPLARRQRSVEIYYKDDMQPMIEDLLNSGIITRAS